MSLLASEARAILEECWVDNGCVIDVTYYEDSSAWVARLYIHGENVDAEDVAEVRGHASPTEAVQALEAAVLQSEALLRRLERMA